MKAYVGQTKDPRMIEELLANGIGECLQRGELTGSAMGRKRSKPGPVRTPWFYDNGAFRDWSSQKSFNYLQWSRDLMNISRFPAPDFVVVPDKVAAGLESLSFSIDCLEDIRAREERLNAYLVVQDGMRVRDVRRHLNLFDGIFVGGTTEWKWQTAQAWVDLAHDEGLPGHIGRAGTIKLIERAVAIGADSLDSSFPLWERERLTKFVNMICKVQMA